jgi:pimeloyl-ACP methyl ester carboxylesterase
VKARWLAVPLLLFLIVLRDHPEPLARHQAEWLEAGTIQLRTVRAGTGDTTLFLLHGYGESLLAYRALFDRLATQFRVVAVDLPGFGLSDKPNGPYDYQTMVSQLGSYLERHIAGPIVIVGHSMGGQLAAGLAMLHPDRVVATVLIAPAGHGLSPWHSAVTGEPADLVGWLNVPIAYLMPIHAPDWLEEGVRPPGRPALPQRSCTGTRGIRFLRPGGPARKPQTTNASPLGPPGSHRSVAHRRGHGGSDSLQPLHRPRSHPPPTTPNRS